ncbi:hypothetical protein Bbelb_423280 [Branchiostoma belcheri]|nr:hypothetical protein Bbelb_423280 [Branchiostoma belcheri]
MSQMPAAWERGGGVINQIRRVESGPGARDHHEKVVLLPRGQTRSTPSGRRRAPGRTATGLPAPVPESPPRHVPDTRPSLGNNLPPPTELSLPADYTVIMTVTLHFAMITAGHSERLVHWPYPKPALLYCHSGGVAMQTGSRKRPVNHMTSGGNGTNAFGWTGWDDMTKQPGYCLLHKSLPSMKQKFKLN